MVISCRCCAGKAKKCTKKRDARVELLVYSLNLLFFWHSPCRRRHSFVRSLVRVIRKNHSWVGERTKDGILFHIRHMWLTDWMRNVLDNVINTIITCIKDFLGSGSALEDSRLLSESCIGKCLKWPFTISSKVLNKK